MKQRNTLIAATLAEVVLLVAVLAGYLIAIAVRLRSISSTLGKVTFGVRAIDTQTKPLGPRLGEINGALGQVAEALQAVAVAGAGGDGDADGKPTQDATAESSPGSIESRGDRPRPTTP
jgi:hypothetical protein